VVDPPNGLRAIVDRIRPSLQSTPGDDLDAVGATHVRLTVDALRSSEGIAAEVALGRCGVVGMTYRLARGRVSVVTALSEDAV
jgi:carbonic anhydrase